MTFAELRRRFATKRRKGSPALLLSPRLRFEPAGPREDAAAPTQREISLKLGGDDERPFAHAEHWAAFACIGA